jgi:large subunit ribosomal protein L32e
MIKMVNQKLLAIRKAAKKRKPTFLRQDAHKKVRIPNNWRKPKGVHSKMRHKKKGYRVWVGKGFRSPVEVRGLSAQGLLPIIVANVKGLGTIDAKSQGIIIAGSVGQKKRVEIVKKANELGITLLNVSAKKYVAAVEEKLKAKKALKEKSLTEKEKKQKEKEKAAEEKKKKDADDKKKEEGKASSGDELAEKIEEVETKKEEEKKEMDKILTQK